MSLPKIRRLGALLLAIGLPLLMVGLGLAIAGFNEIQDILQDEDPDERTKDRAETNLYAATAGTFFFLSASARPILRARLALRARILLLQ